MEKNSEGKIKYFVINTILLLISSILIMFIVWILKNNKEYINVGYEQSANNIISAIEKKEDTIEQNNVLINEEQISFPLVYDKNTTNNTIDIEKYDFNSIPNNKYYYNQLNNNSKLIYSSIEKNLNNMKTGMYEIKLPKEVADVFKYDNGSDMLDRDFQSAWDAITLDRMDVFFIDISKIQLSIKKTTFGISVSYELNIVPMDKSGYLIDSLVDQNSVDLALLKVKKARDEIANNVLGNNYNKILQIHDWIIENLEYSSSLQNENVYNIYGGLNDKVAVCEGYAESLKYILDKIGIPCIIISGTATNSEGRTENHAWNYVQIDEKWYAIDATWDDPVVKGFGYVSNSIKHKYFLAGSETMQKDHIANGKVSSNGQTFQYPNLETKNYK